MKRFVEGEDRSQVVLLPECLDDYVTEDNPVRVIDVFIDEHLDHANRILRFNVVLQTRGQQAHLGSVLAFDESLHAAAPNKLDASV